MLKGKVTGVIRPDNFEGEGSGFSLDIGMNQKKNDYRIELCIPNPQIWWPNGHGAQPLYTLDLTFEPENGAGQSRRETFGIRTIEMAPLPDGPNEDIHNWTFVVNGKPVFVKGANWCTTDALLRCGRERYTRFLTLAKQQHIQLLRAWGGGIPETDLFYDLCDRLGLMVIQEWPTCWDSHKIQPREELYETIRYNVPRLRNHPSLIQWAGGNESAEADGEVMDEMARLTYELDGSRCFHRTSPWGGSIHNYGTYWGLQDIDETLKLKAPFIGEFGMASAPNLQSVRRYLPREEWEVWDTGAVNCFNYHTPRFNQKMWSELDMVHLLKRVPEFYDADTMEHFIIATQLAQATCIRHLLESFRSRWPESTGICYYKLTDVYPACSWSTVDYYGVPKLSYYMIADSYEPLHACITVESMTAGAGWSAPVFLLNDAETPPGDDCKVIVSAYDGGLQQICRQVYEVRESAKVLKLGSFKPEGIEPEKGPLFVTAEVRIDGRTHHRTFYWFNYKDKPGCLFSRPRTSLAWEVQGNELTVANTGNLPAVGVTVECLPHDTEFTVSDSVFWLEAGEKRVLQVSHDDGLSVTAWNI
jgi:beta-mannosidase